MTYLALHKLLLLGRLSTKLAGPQTKILIQNVPRNLILGSMTYLALHKLLFFSGLSTKSAGPQTKLPTQIFLPNLILGSMTYLALHKLLFFGLPAQTLSLQSLHFRFRHRRRS